MIPIEEIHENNWILYNNEAVRVIGKNYNVTTNLRKDENGNEYAFEVWRVLIDKDYGHLFDKDTYRITGVFNDQLDSIPLKREQVIFSFKGDLQFDMVNDKWFYKQVEIKPQPTSLHQLQNWYRNHTHQELKTTLP